jgi:hypothetical protein
MASNNDKSLETLGLSSEERARLEAEEKRRLAELARDISRRYDPARLGKLSIAAAGRAEKLDDDTRRRMEARLGGSFGDVRVVRGAFADRVTRRHGADAVTIGATGLILVRDTPRTNPRTPEGRAILAHELTHVRQAKQGMHFAHTPGSSGSDEAHEVQARDEEMSSLRDEKSLAAAEPDPEERREHVVSRVMEMVGRDLRNRRERRGAGFERR